MFEDKFASIAIELNYARQNTGDTLLHECARKGDSQMAQWLLDHGANPFIRDKNNKTCIDLARDDKIRELLSNSQHGVIGVNKPPHEQIKMSGYLKKWTNYKSGYKLRWLVLEKGILSYFKHKDDTDEACRGSINLRIARIHYDTSNKSYFEIVGKGFKYTLRASHPVEAQRWVWALQAAIQQERDKMREEKASNAPSIHSIGQEVESPLSDTFKRPHKTGSIKSALSEEEDEEDIDPVYNDPDEVHSPALFEEFDVAMHSVQIQMELCERICDIIVTNCKQDTSRQNTSKFADDILSLSEALHQLDKIFVDLSRVASQKDYRWRRHIERLQETRRLYEESLKKIVVEQEEMERAMEITENERKRAEKALKQAQKQLMSASGVPNSPQDHPSKSSEGATFLSDDNTDDEEFFDVNNQSFETSEAWAIAKDDTTEMKAVKQNIFDEIKISFSGYSEPMRMTLDVIDDRPKLSLWAILKSMIGKDMTRMTLPVTFNEPVSLLQRAAEDLEYVDLVDIAATLKDPCQRLLYVAAFAASEYASTMKRIAKPFNPLLGETFEYCRPDKRYRFVMEQVSHHPPIGAAWGESVNWHYCGESSVKSKFYGKSFDINPLGTWFLTLRHTSGVELYTWRKVTSSVVGIILGAPALDNYGEMQIENRTTGECCILDFKRRGWRASTHEEVKGVVLDANKQPTWTIFGHWSDKLFARKVGVDEAPVLLWKVNERPTAPFNLTPFVISLNDLSKSLKPHLPPTDTRLRPDQRAMEEGRYDAAAEEKHRLEEKQRAARRRRELNGEAWAPRWFVQDKHPVTGETFWRFTGDYWKCRAQAEQGKGESAGDLKTGWKRCEDIF